MLPKKDTHTHTPNEHHTLALQTFVGNVSRNFVGRTSLRGSSHIHLLWRFILLLGAAYPFCQIEKKQFGGLMDDSRAFPLEAIELAKWNILSPPMRSPTQRSETCPRLRWWVHDANM